jgi:hypothetical protein
MPAILSESALFIWQPKVVIQKLPRLPSGEPGSALAVLEAGVLEPGGLLRPIAVPEDGAIAPRREALMMSFSVTGSAAAVTGSRSG